MATDRSSLEGQLGLAVIVTLSLINSLFCIFGALGNVIVCYTVWKNTFLQVGANFCIISLTIADLLVCMFTQPVYILSLNGYSNKNFEMVYFVVTSISLYASLNSLLVMTTNRLIAVYFPLKFHSILSKEKIIKIIIGAWVLSVVEGILRTFTDFKVLTSHIRIAAVVVFIVMYCKIFMVARKRKIEIKSQAKSIAFNYGHAARIKSDNRASMTTALIVGSFVLSFLPITILLMIDSTSKLAVEICFTIMCCSSSINPLVYAWRSDRFRDAVLKLLPGCNPRNKVFPISTLTTFVEKDRVVENHGLEIVSQNDEQQSMQEANHKPVQQSEEQADLTVHQCEGQADITVHQCEEQADITVHQCEEQEDITVHQCEEQADLTVQQSDQQADNPVQQNDQQADNPVQQSDQQANNPVQQCDQQADNFVQQSDQQADNPVQQSDQQADNPVQQSDQQADNPVQQNQKELLNSQIHQSRQEVISHSRNAKKMRTTQLINVKKQPIPGKKGGDFSST